MIISRKKQSILPDSPLSVNSHSLERVTSYKYLGVWLTSTLNWSIQVSEVCSRARRQIGFIYRKFYGHVNSSTLLQLYLTYICPLLEYAAPVWDPHHQGLINSLERVQKFALTLCLRDWTSCPPGHVVLGPAVPQTLLHLPIYLFWKAASNLSNSPAENEG